MRNLDIGNFQKIARVMSDKYDVRVIPEGLKFQTNGRVINFPVNSDYLSDMTKKSIHGLLDHEILHILEEDFHKKKNKETPIGIISKLKDKREKIVFGLIEDMRIEIKYSNMYVGIKENISELYDITIPLVIENIRIGKIKDFWNVFSKYIIMKFKGYELDYIDGEYKIFLDLIYDELKQIYEISYGEQSLALARNIIEKIDDKLDELSDDTDEGEGEGDDEGEGEDDEDEGDGDEGEGERDEGDGDEGEGDEGEGDEGEGDEGEGEGDDEDEDEGDGEGDEGDGDEGEGDGDEGEGEGDEGDGDEGDGDEGDGDEGDEGEGEGDEGDGDEEDVSRRVLDMFDRIMEPDSYCDIFEGVKKAISKEAEIDVKENERYIPNPHVLSKDEWIKPESHDIELYRTNKSEVDSQIRGISGKFINVLKSKAISSVQRGVFSGKLDTRSLYKVNIGKTNVYKNKIIGETLDIAISVVVDMSGSMGDSATEGNKAYYARLSCVSLAETFNKLSIPFEIIGFYNNYIRKIKLAPFTHRVEPLVYVVFKDFNEDYNKVKCRLNDITGIGDNTDGEAILEIAKRLYRRREIRKILFVISDGAPLAIHPSPDILEKHLIQVVKTITSSGIEVLSIGMCTNSVALFYNRETGAKNTSIYNMDEFVVKVYNIVKDSLLNKQLS
jgi:cobalamin biosynthesis protein CobT